jgi:NADPH:quinone reductase-like Zn-dependent oxidoreductase
MRAIVIPRPGPPEVLEVREAPEPEVGPGKVKVRVKAAGLNFADVMARMGLYPDAPKMPMTVGYEVAGEIAEIGEGVEGLRRGEPVLAMCRFGGQSEVVVVPAEQVTPKPENLSFEETAAIPVNYLTAWHALVWLGNLRRGERVLIHAAAGGVGLAALQICKIYGAEAIGTASASKHEALRAEGLAHAIDYNTEDFEAAVTRLTNGKGVHHVLDAVGGPSFKKSYRCLATTGRLYCFGNSSMSTGKDRSVISAAVSVIRMPFFHPINLMNQNRGVFGINLGHMWDAQEILREELTAILGHVREGRMRPKVAATFPFAEAAAAHTYIQERKNFGKVILVP